MTTRHKPLPDAPKGKCRFCLGDIPKNSRRRTWCSEKCHDEGWIRSSATFAKWKVFERDRGICAEPNCKLDTEAVREKFRVALAADEAATFYRCTRCADILDPAPPYMPCDQCGGYRRAEVPFTERQRLIDELNARGYKINMRPWQHSLPTLWEMDHAVPVIEGGGECGLENLRTLCVPCHRLATAALAKRRAHVRRAEKKREGRINAAAAE